MRIDHARRGRVGAHRRGRVGAHRRPRRRAILPAIIVLGVAGAALTGVATDAAGVTAMHVHGHKQMTAMHVHGHKVG